MKTTFFLFSWLLFSSACATNNFICPTVTELKQNQLNFWLPLYVANEELASAIDVTRFKQHVTQLMTVKWSNRYLEYARCIYIGDAPIISKIIFARDAWRPTESPNWIWTQPKVTAECHSSDPKDCEFIQ